MHVCVHVHTQVDKHMYIYIYMFVWRPDVTVKCLSRSFFTLFLTDVSFRISYLFIVREHTCHDMRVEVEG